MPNAKLQPDKSEILRHLTHLTRRWPELNEDVLLEVVHLSAEDRAQVKHVAHYKPDDMGLDLAADDIAAMNQHKINCYATVNPVSASNRPPAGRRASAEHIVASFFHFADADNQQAAENIKNFVGPKFTFSVLTGTQPCRRPHVYWELEEPTRNLAAWSATQAAIAATLKTDKVIDPPRIMRLAGTVNWPKPQKVAKGYIAEVTELRIFDSEERQPVSSERMARAFSTAAAAAPDGDPFHIDTGPQPLDRERARIQALSGEQWNNAVFALVGSYVARGHTDGEILALIEPLTLSGYTVADTRDEVQAMIDRTRANPRFEGHNTPTDEQFREFTQEEKDAIPAAPFRPWVRMDLTTIPHPEFVYSDFYARGYTSLTLAAPKVGKSMLGLAEAIDMATGRGFLTRVQRDPMRVVYFNAEDDQNVINGRVSALLAHYSIDQSEIEGRLFPTSGVDMDDFFLVSGQDGIVNEALFVGIEKFCQQERADVLIFDPLQDLSRSPETNEVFRLLGQRLRRLANTSNVALGLIHHTRKVTAGMSPTIDDGRGGSALRGTSRFNRILIGMTEDEGIKAGIANHRHFLRVGDMESNLAPPSADVNRWFEKISVIAPNGHSIGAIAPWSWPDAFDGVSIEKANECRIAVMQADPRPRQSVQSDDWVGNIIGGILDIDISDKAGRSRVSAIVKTWIEKDVLAVEKLFSKRDGRDVPYVVAGRNNPMETPQ